jgi:hypothetical protein
MVAVAAVSPAAPDSVGDAVGDAAVGSGVGPAPDPAPPHALTSSTPAVTIVAPDDRRSPRKLITPFTVTGFGGFGKGPLARLSDAVRHAPTRLREGRPRPR